MSTILTGLRDAQGRAIVSLPIAVRAALMQADEILRAHGMQFEILCETCQALAPDDANGWTVHAEHGGGDGSVDTLVCPCTRRRFQASM